MKSKIILTFLLISVSIYTSNLEVMIGLKTTHSVKIKYYDLNESNNLILLKYNNIVIGGMRNSFNKNSLIFGFNKDIAEKLSVTMMLASGYSKFHKINTGAELYCEDRYVIGNDYKLLPLINYRLSKNILISTNGLITMTCLTFEL